MRRRPQFTLSSLMLWLVVLGMALGWWIDHRRAAKLEGQVQHLTHVLEGTESELRSGWGIDFSYSLSRTTVAIGSRDGTRLRLFEVPD